MPEEVAAASAARGRERGSLTSAGVEVFDSVRTHYRLRARFDVLPDFRDPDGRRLAYVMWNQPPPKPRALVEDFPIASAAINALMPRLLRACEAHAVLRSGLASAFFHSTLLYAGQVTESARAQSYYSESILLIRRYCNSRFHILAVKFGWTRVFNAVLGTCWCI